MIRAFLIVLALAALSVATRAQPQQSQILNFQNTEPPEVMIQISGKDGLLVSLHRDGRVEVTGGTIDDGAKAFWDAVSRTYLASYCAPGAKP